MRVDIDGACAPSLTQTHKQSVLLLLSLVLLSMPCYWNDLVVVCCCMHCSLRAHCPSTCSCYLGYPRLFAQSYPTHVEQIALLLTTSRSGRLISGCKAATFEAMEVHCCLHTSLVATRSVELEAQSSNCQASISNPTLEVVRQVVYSPQHVQNTLNECDGVRNVVQQRAPPRRHRRSPV